MLARWLLASALVPYHILKLQDDAVAADRKVDMTDRARRESLMREQLEAMHSMRAQVEQQPVHVAGRRPRFLDIVPSGVASSRQKISRPR